MRHFLPLAGLILSACAAAPQDQLEQQVKALNEQVKLLREDLTGVESESVDQEISAEFQFHSVDEVDRAFATLGSQASAQAVADSLAKVDAWPIRPEDEEKALKSKQQLLMRLRKQVESEVQVLQEQSLRAATGKEALRLHNDAAQILALYPITEDETAVLAARRLASNQSEILVRIEVLRRQRYNLWAMKRIEQALSEFNKKKNLVDTTGENSALMSSLVTYLAEVDPILLEPAVVDLYRYVLDLTKGRISESQKVELAKNLVSPKQEKPRKTLGDF